MKEDIFQIKPVKNRCFLVRRHWSSRLIVSSRTGDCASKVQDEELNKSFSAELDSRIISDFLLPLPALYLHNEWLKNGLVAGVAPAGTRFSRSAERAEALRGDATSSSGEGPTGFLFAAKRRRLAETEGLGTAASK